MKKLNAKHIVSIILCFSLGLGVVGCTHDETFWRDEQKEFGAYSDIWDAADETLTHEIGGLAVDGGWGVASEADGAGALVSVETAKLNAPAYTAAARLLTSESNLTSKTVVAVLRVVAKNGTELGRLNVRLCDFKKTLAYQDFLFTFSVSEATEARFEIYWPGTAYVRASQFGIMSKSMNGTDPFETGESILGGALAEEESALNYDPNALYTFDLYGWMNKEAANSEDAYDVANLVSTLQGLVNRDGQHLFLHFLRTDAANGFGYDTDNYWLEYLTANGGWLAGKEIVEVKSPKTLLRLFSDFYTGFAAWDPAVPATVNAVATACGVDDLLPVRYSSVQNSLYYYFAKNSAFEGKDVKVNLGGKFTGDGKIYMSETNSTGSRKNDVYLWAKEQYLDTHKTNSHLVAYHVDAYATNNVFASYSDLQNMFLSNRDYYIANKAFFFDLSPMGYEVPDDDPDQTKIFGEGVTKLAGDAVSVDYQTFVKLMTAQAAYAESVNAAEPIDVGGFTPWHLKYTRFTNPDASGEVDCEWETVYQFSIFNAYINADAPAYTAMANASIYEKFPMETNYVQRASKNVKEKLPAANEAGKNYLLFYVGDFDASAWLNMAMIGMWNDENRGALPLAWSFSLNLYKRAGHVIDMMYNTASANDYFVAGDNGVGYLNPQSYANELSKDVYGDLDSWAAYNKEVYERFDIDYTGFLITRNAGYTREIFECYKKFCKGAGTNIQGSLANTPDDFLTAWTINIDNIDDPSVYINRFSPKTAGSPSTFLQLRFILKTPTQMLNFYNRLRSTYPEYNFEVVDPYTFYGLMAEQKARG